MSVNQLSGCFAFINYTADIFMESGSSLTPNVSAIIVAVIQVAGSTVSTFAIGNISRKLLYASTCFGVMIGLLAMGTHGYLKNYYDMSNFNWVPIASLSFVIFIASIGLLPLTFVMLSEILPQKVRQISLETRQLIIIIFINQDSELWRNTLHCNSVDFFISPPEIFCNARVVASTLRVHVWILCIHLYRNGVRYIFCSRDEKQK